MDKKIMAYKEKIMNIETAKTKRKELAAEGKRVVFTNGCFDLLHPGHLRYLEEARALGDFLFVGLNSDVSVRGLKGPERPICPEDVRAEMLAGLAMVDGVALFEEPTPLNLITALEPDVLVKGGDWPLDQIVGANFVLALGGEVKPLLLAGGFSSTDLIERIKKLASAGKTCQ